MNPTYARTIATSMLLLLAMPLAIAAPEIVVEVSTARSIECESQGIDSRDLRWLDSSVTVRAEDCDAAVGYDDRHTLDARCNDQRLERHFSTPRVTVDDDCGVHVLVLV